MVEFENLRFRLLESEKPIENLREALAIDHITAEIKDLEAQAAAPDFWEDMDNSQRILKKTGALKAKLESYNSLKADYEDALMMIELADDEGDESLLEECEGSVKNIEDRIETLTLSTLLNGEYDNKNALLTFHAGAGGTEAMDWAEMLFRMYNRWGERHGYKVSTLDYLDGDVAGLIAQPYDHGNFKDNECATKEYWQAVRKFCDEHGMVLIFDDVRTGFRLDIAGSDH